MTTLEQVEVHEDQVPASSLDWDIEAMMDELEESPPRRQASEADEVKRETRDRNPSSSAESEPPRRKPKKLIEDRRFNVVRPKTND